MKSTNYKWNLPNDAIPSVAQKLALALLSDSKKKELTTKPKSCLYG